MEIKEGKVKTPLKLVVYGTEGIGKSTLASNAPDPLFIDIEGGTNQLNVKRLDPAPIYWKEFLNQIDYVIKHPDICKTLVIDTIDAAEPLAMDEVCIEEKTKSIAKMPHGQGYVLLDNKIIELIHKLDQVIEVGINVIVIAHSQVKRFTLPDEMGEFDRYELKLQKRTSPKFKEWCDALLFCNYKTYVMNNGNKGKATGGKRVIYTTHHPAWDAKNRFGLEDELPLTYSSIKPMFDQDYPEINLDVADDDPVFDEPSVTVKTNGQVEAHDSAGNIVEDPDFTEIAPDEIHELMKKSSISEEQIVKALINIGQLESVDQTLDDVDSKFLKNNIIDKWDSFSAYLKKI